MEVPHETAASFPHDWCRAHTYASHYIAVRLSSRAAFPGTQTLGALQLIPNSDTANGIPH